MSQTKYVNKYRKYSIADCKSMETYIETRMELLPSADAKLVGTSFKWETNSYAVGIVSLSMASPKFVHWKEENIIVRFMKGDTIFVGE